MPPFRSFWVSLDDSELEDVDGDSDGSDEFDDDGEEGAEDDAEVDPRPYGGWRWSASHSAWVGGTHCTMPPPSAPPEDWNDPDPLEGRMLVPEEEMMEMVDDEEEAAVLEAYEDDERAEAEQEEAAGYWGSRDDDL